jgi:septum formation protein
MLDIEVILGSQSPRRVEILDFFSLPFKQVHSKFDETQVPFLGNPASFSEEVSRGKALALQQKYPDKVIVTADTVVFRAERLFMKPTSLKEAADMLKELSGKEHQVFTGVSVCMGEKIFSDSEESKVFFHELSDTQIEAYHRCCNPLDKAGGYAIQKGGSLIVKRIEGCYYNIMGLPLQTLRRLLLKVGIDLWDHLGTVC